MRYKFAIAYLGTLTVCYHETWGECMAAINDAVKQQRPYTTFFYKERPGHSDPIWHPGETRFFDPKR